MTMKRSHLGGIKAMKGLPEDSGAAAEAAPTGAPALAAGSCCRFTVAALHTNANPPPTTLHAPRFFSHTP